jgi:micrococcal nuclease
MNAFFRSRFFPLCVFFFCVGLGTSVQTQNLPNPESYPQFDTTNKTPCDVIRIVDSDSIEIKIDGRAEIVRLIGISVPKVGKSGGSRETSGNESLHFLSNLLKGERVYIEYDPEVKKDGYGRLSAYLFRAPDGLFINLELVRQGYARTLDQYSFTYFSLFQHYENKAQEIRKGLWSAVPSVKKSASIPPQASPTSIIEKPKQEQKQEVTVYITRTGAKYHRAGCRYLSKSMIPISLEGANKMYSPCSVCNPPR